MGYEEWKADLLDELKEFYGNDAEILVRAGSDNREWIEILRAESKNICVPRVFLDKLYVMHMEHEFSVSDCAGVAIDVREKSEHCLSIARNASQLMEWEKVKDKVYPILLPGDVKEKNMDGNITEKFLDLTVAYVVRLDFTDQWSGCVDITADMLKHYDVTMEQLRETAQRNMEQDGYEFYELEQYMMTEDYDKIAGAEKLEPKNMYLLHNACGIYGAAGMLNKSLFEKIAGTVNCLLIPFSVHKVIVIPESIGFRQAEIDEMFGEISVGFIEQEDYLTKHTYFYDGKTGEIRITV